MVTAYPENSDGWFALSVCLKHSRKVKEATDAALHVEQLQPGRVANIINLADNFRLLGETGKARLYLEKARNLQADSEVVSKLEQMLG
jgi:Flp pilus assembly protein TadD